MSTKRDYYEILGVGKDADKDAIKKAYRKLALKHHPDRNKEAGAEEAFKELSEAYAVLSDPEKRRLYDQYGHAGVDQRFSQEDIFRGADFGDIFGNLEHIFGQFFGGGFGQRSRQPGGGRDLVTTVEVGLEDVARGTRRDLEIERPATCDACNGSGAAPGTKAHRCQECGGAGQVRNVQRSIFGQFVQLAPCRACGGHGTRVDTPCPTCRGQGRALKRDTISVRIPQGVHEGTRLRITGAGEAGARGSPTGDLYVQIHVKDHPRFQRDDADLHTVLPIRFAQAALGDELTIQGVLGQDLTLKIPPGSQHGSRLRLRGQGLPRLQAAGQGDLFVHLHIDVPKKIPKEAQEHLAAFDKALGGDGAHAGTGFLKHLFTKGKD